ncbi:MAG TPA: ABC transporter permease, partial [Clostridiales bacterium]|nr:ABC transporter permease [Clostridiales bacterium]
MFRLHLKRSGRDIIGHLILIFLPVILITFLSYVFSSGVVNNGVPFDISYISTPLTIGAALTFQIYGSALSFETLGQDFFTPMHDRLLASPANPRKLIVSILSTSIVVSFLQTIVILIFSIVLLDAKFNNLFLVIILMFLSAVFNQLLGSIILFSSKKVSAASGITTIYGTIAPMITEVYFPLPDNIVLNFIKRYLTPMGLAKTAIMGAIENNVKDVLLATIPLLVYIIVLFILIKPLAKRI